MIKHALVTPAGLLLNIKLTPKSKKVGFLGVLDNCIKIGVSSPPVDNKANEELIKFLSKEFKVPKKSVVIESGETSKLKRVLIVGARGTFN